MKNKNIVNIDKILRRIMCKFYYERRYLINGEGKTEGGHALI